MWPYSKEPKGEPHASPPQKSLAKTLSPNDALTLIHISRKKGVLIYAVTLLGILCDLRRGEICGLRWDNIDFNKRTLYIHHNLNRYKNETIENGKFALVIPGGKSSLVLSHPKTDSSEANIIVSVMVVELLRELQDCHKKNTEKMGTCYMDYDFILSWEDGRPCTPAWGYHTSSKLLKDNNLQHIRVHDLRHTAATLMLYQDVDIKLVSHQLRHQNTEITQNLY